MHTAISVDRLTQTSPGHTALHGVSFAVPERTTFALVGGHGSGKSTVVGCLATHVTPTSGTVHVGRHRVGLDDRRIRREVGVVFQKTRFDPARTVWENLLISADAHGYSGRSVQRGLEELAGILQIVSFLDRRYGNLTSGLRRRADIVGALVHDPSVVVLDEPTAGLEDKDRDLVWATINRLTKDLCLTTFITTTDQTEADRADAACVISEGRTENTTLQELFEAPAADISHAPVGPATPATSHAPVVPVAPIRSVAPVVSVAPAAPAPDELRLLLHDPTALSLISAYDITARGDLWVVGVHSWAEAREILRLLDGSISDFDFVSGVRDTLTPPRSQAPIVHSTADAAHLRAIASR